MPILCTKIMVWIKTSLVCSMCILREWSTKKFVYLIFEMKCSKELETDWFDLCLRGSLSETLPLLTRDGFSNYIIFCRYMSCPETNIMQHAIDNKMTNKNITLCDLEVCFLRLVTNAWLSIWNKTFLFACLTLHRYKAKTIEINSKVVISKRIFVFYQPLGHEK